MNTMGYTAPLCSISMESCVILVRVPGRPDETWGPFITSFEPKGFISVSKNKNTLHS